MILLLKARPTPAQAAAGNYRKPRVHWNGLEIAIENPVGTVREGKGWRTKMQNAYGYVCRSEGVDGDEVDVYLGPDMETAPTVYVVHQRRYGDWKAYDEDKCMLGFASEAAARAAYLAHYDDDRFLGPITAMPVADFVAKVKATRERPAMIKSDFGVPVVVVKAHVGPYMRNGRMVNVAGYQGRQAQASRVEQPGLFDRPKAPLGPNPFKGKHPVLDTPDLFSGETMREREPDDDEHEKHLDRLIEEMRAGS